MILYKNKKIRGQKGFSFLEVIISLFVLSVGFLGVITLATSTLRNSLMQRDAVIASALVQEGIELVYNIRDTNVAKYGESNAFDGDGKPSTSNDNINAGSYRIDYLNSSGLRSVNCVRRPTSCKLSLSNGFYRYAVGAGVSRTKFSRKVIIEDTSDIPNNVIARKITSVVVWGTEGFPSSSVTATTCNKSTHCSFTQAELQENN